MRRLPWLLLLSACGEPADGPVTIAFGEDAFDVCRMIVSEPSYAAQARFERSRAAHFVRSRELKTPMASGLAAFASRDAVAAFASRYPGVVLAFEELLRDAESSTTPRFPPRP